MRVFESADLAALAGVGVTVGGIPMDEIEQQMSAIRALKPGVCDAIDAMMELNAAIVDNNLSIQDLIDGLSLAIDGPREGNDGHDVLLLSIGMLSVAVENDKQRNPVASLGEVMSNDPGPQKQPCSVAKIEAETKSARFQLGPPPLIIAIQVKREAFRFTSYEQWVNKGRSWYGGYTALETKKMLAIDTEGRVCWTGSEFMRARDEETFPVVVYEA